MSEEVLTKIKFCAFNKTNALLKLETVLIPCFSDMVQF